MEDKIKVFEVREEVIRHDKDKSERIIFECIDGVWFYHAPNAQNHNEKQIEIILQKLRELNSKELEGIKWLFRKPFQN